MCISSVLYMWQCPSKGSLVRIKVKTYFFRKSCCTGSSGVTNLSVVWSSSLTKGEEYDIERIQKVALRIIFTDEYTSYEHALNLTNLPTLKARRSTLCLNFALKCTKLPKTADMRDSDANTRNPEKFEVNKSKRGGLKKSSIPFMQRQLNKHAAKCLFIL